MTPAVAHSYQHHRFPGEIISHAVWWYFRFPLSHRAVEELLCVRGIIVSYEAIRKWCRKFGQAYANAWRRRRPRPGDKWHLDEVCITMNTERPYLWRAVDQDGNVLDILVQSRRKKQAAQKFFRKLLKGCQYVPRGDCLKTGSEACWQVDTFSGHLTGAQPPQNNMITSV